MGAKVAVMDQFEPEAHLELVERYRITASQVVPTMFVRLLKSSADVRDRYDVSTLRVVIHAAAPCPVPVKEQLIDWFGPVIHEYYAGTEGNGLVYCDSERWPAHPATVGTPIAYTIHICGDDGNELPAGERGTIFFEGQNSFEYHNDPEKTAKSRHPNGWSGGVNIYPQESENVLDFRDELPRHPTGKLDKRLLKDEYWAATGRSI